ncbi:MAG: DCC1-like thiol-disulfide oxidoreductase family protein [Proteobacteria bacterium]|nr:DCC1-like thiol-disulfide oxidoreductase family protein [Pseudomonadota bacterium]
MTEPAALSGKNANWLIYDGECPFCSNYIAALRLRQSSEVRLIDARLGGVEADICRAAGLDLDEGIVLHLDGFFYHGADCLNRLALLTTGADWFNRASRAMFRSSVVSSICYPVLRAGRNLTLRLLGRKPMHPLAQGW